MKYVKVINQQNMMRILHVSKYYFPYNGGIENTCQQLAEGFPNDKTAVVCFNEGKEDIVETINGIQVYRAGSIANVARQSLSLSLCALIKKAIKEFKPDIIHLHWCNPFGGAMLLMVIPKDVKLVIHWHSDVVNQELMSQKLIYKIIKPIETALLKRADLVLTTSPLYVDESKPLQPYKGKVKVLQSAIDTSKFQVNAEEAKKIEEIKKKYQGKPIVFFIGRHVTYKGIELLLESEKYIHSDCVFLIAGKGPLTETLKAKVKSNRVHFVGRVSDEELKWYNRAATVFAFPSMTKQEAFGLALVEAMYSESTPVCFTIPGSGVNWVSIKDETGLEVENGNIHAYAEAIDRLMSDDVLRQRLAHNARKRVEEKFTVPVMLSILNNYYKSLLNNSI